MPLPTITEQVPDGYDVIQAGDKSYDPAEQPIFNGLDNGPDSPEWKKMQYAFDIPSTPNNQGSAAGGQWAQAAVTVFGDPTRLYLRGHHQKYLVGADEVTQGDKGYAMNGLSPEQYQIMRMIRQLVVDGELICMGAQEAQAGSTVQEYRTRGLELIIVDTTLRDGLQTDVDTRIPTEFLPSTAQVKEVTAGVGDFAFVEGDLNAMMNGAFDLRKVRVKWKGWVTTRLKNKISAWGNLAPTVADTTNVRRFSIDAAEMKIVNSIQKWVGDAGEVDLALHGYLRMDTDVQRAEGLFLVDGFQNKRLRMKPKMQKMDDDAGVKRSYAMMQFGVQCVPIFNGQVRRAAA